jgi:hypothetical protein
MDLCIKVVLRLAMYPFIFPSGPRYGNDIRQAKRERGL